MRFIELLFEEDGDITLESTRDADTADRDTIDAIDAWANRKGFQFLNSGSDARVYTNANNTAVLKALISSYGMSPIDAAVGFLTFYNFCKRNPSNPHLPTFAGPPKRVVINGESIIYAEMEMLKNVNKRKERIIDDLLERHLGKPWEELGQTARNIETLEMLRDPKEQQHMWHSFYLTLCKLYAYFNKRNPVGIRKKSTAVAWDMGGSNIMSRNGVPVITDPFIID